MSLGVAPAKMPCLVEQSAYPLDADVEEQGYVSSLERAGGSEFVDEAGDRSRANLVNAHDQLRRPRPDETDGVTGIQIQIGELSALVGR